MSGPYSVTITAGVTTTSFVVPIFDDGILEDDEDFILIIASSPIPVVDPLEANVTILDDDGKIKCDWILEN